MITEIGTNVQGESCSSSPKCCLQSVILTHLTPEACSSIAPFFLPTHPFWATSQLKVLWLDFIWEDGKERRGEKKKKKEEGV